MKIKITIEKDKINFTFKTLLLMEKMLKEILCKNEKAVVKWGINEREYYFNDAGSLKYRVIR